MRAASPCPYCRLTLARCLLWMLVIAHLFVATAGAASLSHVPLGDLAHVHVSDGHTHDHSHHADEPDSTDAHPAHDATDHSHDKPNVPPLHQSRAPACAAALNADEKRHDYHTYCSPPERPPKSLPMS